jgi:hypothetical protein
LVSMLNHQSTRWLLRPNPMVTQFTVYPLFTVTLSINLKSIANMKIMTYTSNSLWKQLWSSCSIVAILVAALNPK